MSPVTPTTTMSQHQMDDLVETLRRANAHNSHLAAASRAVSRPSHKARKQARVLRLSISVEAASTLDPKYISTVPLPVLELTPSPSPDVDDARPAFEIAAPIPRYPSQIGTDGLAKKLSRPVLRCAIPTQTIITFREHVASSVPDQCVLTSKWSASTAGTGETEAGDDDEDTLEPDVPQPPQIGVRYARADDNENMDILVSPDVEDQEHDDDFAPIHTQFVHHLPLVTIQIPPQNNQKHSPRPPLPTRIPQQAAPLQQQEQETSPRAVEPGLSHFSSGSDSSQSSLELVTPITSEELLPVSMTRIKRKSILEDVDMDDEDDDYCMVVEKRPKYEPNVLNERRGHQRTTFWSRKNVSRAN